MGRQGLPPSNLREPLPPGRAGKKPMRTRLKFSCRTMVPAFRRNHSTAYSSGFIVWTRRARASRVAPAWVCPSSSTSCKATAARFGRKANRGAVRPFSSHCRRHKANPTGRFPRPTDNSFFAGTKAVRPIESAFPRFSLGSLGRHHAVPQKIRVYPLASA